MGLEAGTSDGETLAQESRKIGVDSNEIYLRFRNVSRPRTIQHEMLQIPNKREALVDCVEIECRAVESVSLVPQIYQGPKVMVPHYQVLIRRIVKSRTLGKICLADGTKNGRGITQERVDIARRNDHQFCRRQLATNAAAH